MDFGMRFPFLYIPPEPFYRTVGREPIRTTSERWSEARAVVEHNGPVPREESQRAVQYNRGLMRLFFKEPSLKHLPERFPEYSGSHPSKVSTPISTHFPRPTQMHWWTIRMQIAFPYVFHTPFTPEKNARFFATERAKPSLER